MVSWLGKWGLESGLVGLGQWLGWVSGGWVSGGLVGVVWVGVVWVGELVGLGWLVDRHKKRRGRGFTLSPFSYNFIAYSSAICKG